MKSGDIVFGNCEGVYSNDWERAPSSGVPLIANPRGVNALANSNFNVMSLANNHTLDGGYEALFKTVRNLKSVSITPVGAGMSYDDAHTPAIIHSKSLKVAILAYTSVFPHGYEARCNVAGLSVLRAHNLYVPWETNEWNPGLSPKVLTIPVEQDYTALQTDINRAKKVADIVILSIHWGDFTRPFVLTDHEKRTARFAIDAGADVILGHHHHLIRGIEFYKEKPIFYGLGHFAFDLPDFESRLNDAGYLIGQNYEQRTAVNRRFGEYRLHSREGYPLLPFHPEARMTMIAKFLFDEHSECQGVQVIPCIIGQDNSPKPIGIDNQKIADVVLNYLMKNCKYEDLQIYIDTKIDKEGYLNFQVTSPGEKSNNKTSGIYSKDIVTN